MHRLLPIVALALALVASHPVLAAMLGDASVPFSADRAVTVNGRTYAGTVFHIPGRQRHEVDIHGMKEVVILSAPEARGWLLLPTLKTFVEFPFPQVMAELGDPSLRRQPVGMETVNGVRTTKYRIDHTAEDGTHAKGFAWVGDGGVLMQIDGTVARPDSNRPVSIHMELSHLRLAPQDPGLFQVPQGFIKLPTDALQPLLGGKAG